LLDLLGVYHVMAGNVVEVGGRRLLVEEACSGVNSLFSALACTLFFAMLVRRPLVHTALLLASAVGWVLAANALRVAAVAYVAVRWGADLSDGWRHQALGAGLFAAVLGLIWSTDRFLLFLTAPSGPPKSAAGRFPAAETPRPAAAPRTAGAAAWVLAVGYLVLLAAHLWSYAKAEAAGQATEDRMAPLVAKLDAEAFPDRIDRWRRQNYVPESRDPGSAFGEHSKTWTYQAGANTAALSLDYTFPGWHDLTRCYTGQGWAMDEQVVRRAGGGDRGAPEGFVAVKLSKPGYRSGYLLFSQLDQDGAPLEPRLGAAQLSLYRHEAILRRWLSTLGGGPVADRADPPGPVYQLQVFVECYSPLGATERADAEALFQRAWRALQARQHPAQ
jgi:exosortase/archaeosortase family protein